MRLFDGLICDAALLAATPPDPADVVTAHRSARSGAAAGLLGPLVAPDSSLAILDRCAEAPIEVVVLNSGGAGGLPALAGRSFTQLRPVGVISPLRDPDDLAGNTARVAAAARELADEVDVYVEFPAGYGWQQAVAAAEADGLAGSVDLGLAPEQLIEQLHAFIEADLAFRAGRLGPGPALGPPALAAVIDALVDDASTAEAIDLLGRDEEVLAAEVGGYDEGRTGRIRRRLQGIDYTDVWSVIDRLPTSAAT